MCCRNTYIFAVTKFFNLRIVLFLALTFFSIQSFAQQPDIYNPKADAKADIAQAVSDAKATGKYVLIIAGGNWCKWCREFENFSTTDKPIDSVMKNSFVKYHLNYSPENTNTETFRTLQHPERFGFPVFIILDGDGKRIHTENNDYLKDGRGSYDRYKVQAFLEMWSPRALDSKIYGDF